MLEDARAEADRLRAAAEADAIKARADAEERARRMVLDARATADGVRAEGMELVSNLREMGDVLRANAERLLHDIQSIHSRMVSDLERVDPGGGGDQAIGPGESSEDGPPASGAGDELEVPDFIPQR